MSRLGLQCVGADQCIRPIEPRGENLVSPLRGLGRYISWFKRMTTNEYIRRVERNAWPPFRGRLWQRNYHDRIIRDEAELQRIRNYIVQNPWRWEEDRNHPSAPQTSNKGMDPWCE